MADYSRSRSPRREAHPRDSRHARRRSRSRSPHRSRPHHHRQPCHTHTDTHNKAIGIQLPFGANRISKHQDRQYRSLFALYLDVQKQLFIDDLSEHEVRGRWKSFINKWNRGELAEGWYDPTTFTKAEASAAASNDRGESPHSGRRASPEYTTRISRRDGSDSDDDDAIGPALPGEGYHNERRAGPVIPGRDDLEQRDELAAEDARNRVADLRFARRQDRKQQKERLEELAPRAEPGSRERQLEKKREVAASGKAYREGNDGGAEDVAEGDLLGDDGVDSYKTEKREAEKKKNEREIRKEELLRVRAAEREERLAEHRAKEDKTMEMLKALAKQRYG